MPSKDANAIGVIKNLRYRHKEGSFTLRIDSLEICSHEVVVLMGPNGAGKSTLSLLLSGVLAPQTGQVLIQGYNATDNRAKYYLSYLPEGGFLFAGLSGKDNLNIFAKLIAVALGQQEREIRDRAVALLTEFRFPFHYFRAPAKTYSEGMRRKIELALALAPEVPLYILDMPTKGLDIEAKHQLYKHFHNLKARGAALLLSTHVSEEAEIIGDHFYFLRGGNIVARVTTNELNHYFSAVVALEPVILFERHRAALERQGGVFVEEQILFFDKPFAEVQHLVGELLGDAIQSAPVRISSRPPTLKDYYIFFTRIRA